MITASAFGVRSVVGPVVLTGTDSGEVVVFEMLSCSQFKCISTGDARAGASGGSIVTALACHPSMMSADGAGEDIFYAGHGDGSVKAARLMKGDVVATFSPPVIERLDSAS